MLLDERGRPNSASNPQYVLVMIITQSILRKFFSAIIKEQVWSGKEMLPSSFL